MTVKREGDLAKVEPRMLDDAEAETASGVPVPSLRVLQGTGAIRSEKVDKFHGGFRRMWPENEVLKAAIAAALSEHFSWNIRLVAAAMARGGESGLWDAVIMMSLAVAERSEPMVPENKIMLSEQLDIFAELIDRKFLFLRVPEKLLPIAGHPVPDILLGIAAKSNFQSMSSAILSSKGQEMAIQVFGEEKADRVVKIHRLAMSIHNNYVSKSNINLSMQVRAAWRRIYGMDAKFLHTIFEQDNAL